MFVLFNKEKKFIGYSPDIPSQVDILKKEIPASKRDFSVWKWVGDYDNGSMISIFEEDYPKEELDLEKKLFSEINSKYPLNTQLINIMRQVKILSEASPMHQDCVFLDMADEILNAIELQEKRIKYITSRSKIFYQNAGLKQK
jgi:hypothetical protein